MGARSNNHKLATIAEDFIGSFRFRSGRYGINPHYFIWTISSTVLRNIQLARLSPIRITYISRCLYLQKVFIFHCS